MKTIILDNDGKTFDRYTIITNTGDMFGASENPFNALGFGQYCGNVCQQFDPSCKLYNEKKGAWPTWFVKDCLKKYLADCENVGHRVKESELPAPVQQYIQQVAA